MTDLIRRVGSRLGPWLRSIFEGIAAVHARHALLARAVQAAVECWSQGGALSLHCRVPEARSVSVTTIDVDSGIDVEALRSVARERFQVAFAGGLGAQTGRAFRIGHLGDVNAAMILGCLAGVEAAEENVENSGALCSKVPVSGPCSPSGD